MPTDPSASPRTAPPPRLGILAGSGPLPRRLVETCLDAGRPFFVLAFDGETEAATVAGTDHAWVRVGAVGKAISLLKQAGCGELVLAGPVRRRSIASFCRNFFVSSLTAISLNSTPRRSTMGLGVPAGTTTPHQEGTSMPFNPISAIEIGRAHV